MAVPQRPQNKRRGLPKQPWRNGKNKGHDISCPTEIRRVREPALAGGSCWFFLFGFFFFFLFFFLEFVAYEFEDGDFGAVADAVACGDDAGVAPSAVRELGCDFAEEFLGDSGRHDVGVGLAARFQRVSLADAEHWFVDRTSGLS